MGTICDMKTAWIVTDFTKRARTDQSLKGIKKLYKEDPELSGERSG